MKTLEQLQQELDNNIPRSSVKQREGSSGKMFSYLSTDHVIDRMNKVFGNLNWSTSTEEIRLVHQGEVTAYGKTKHVVHYIARVKIEAQHINAEGRVVRTQHMGVGYGDGSDKDNVGKAHELAAKEAESDALKRACKNLGQSMGLALYDKEQTNVEDDPPAGKSHSAPGTPTPISSPKATAPTNGNATSATASDQPKSANIASDSSGRETGNGRRTNPDPTRPAFNRQAVNNQIGTLSKIVIRQGKAKIEELKFDMLRDYGTAVKEQLSDENAQAFLSRLEKSASA